MHYMYIRDDDNSKSTGVIVSDLLVSVNYRRQRLAAGGKRNGLNERDESALPLRIGLSAMWRRNVPMITRFCRTSHIYYARVSG